MQTVVAILAGGQSRRMGADKAGLMFGGMTLLERAARAALSAGLSPFVVGRARPEGWTLSGVNFVEDGVPGRGPLGGLAAALHHAQGSVLAVACDLPLLSGEALRWLADRAAEGVGEHGLAVINNARLEPLFSVYTPSCAPLVQSHLVEGRLSLHGLMEVGDFRRIDAPDWVRAQLININTPEDLARLIRAAKPHPSPLLRKERELEGKDNAPRGSSVS